MAKVDQIRRELIEGRVGLLAVGAVRSCAAGLLPFMVVDEDEAEIEAFSLFLRDLVLTDMSPLTVRSYGNDLLRWWRILQLLGVTWDQAGRAEVEVIVGWMRSAANPQRRDSGVSAVNMPCICPCRWRGRLRTWETHILRRETARSLSPRCRRRFGWRCVSTSFPVPSRSPRSAPSRVRWLRLRNSSFRPA